MTIGFIVLAVVTGLVAVITFGAGVYNFLGSPKVREEFARYGYPSYWYWLTGILEIVAAIFLVIPATRWFAALVLIAVYLAALATVLWYRDTEKFVPCILLLIGSIFIAYSG